MALFVLRDLHLSFGVEKPMDVFTGWENHAERIRNNWLKLVKENDTVIIPGDISWALNIEDAVKDFEFIESLPGQKIISKGNHDLWWQTMSKNNKFLSDHNFKTIRFLHNNAYEVENYIICGTRGWIFENGQQRDDKVIAREAGRLKMSLDYIKNSDKEKIVFLHYPPVYQEQRANRIIDLMKEHNIKRCYYGHLHGRTIYYAFNKELEGIKYRLVSADALNFCPYIID